MARGPQNTDLLESVLGPLGGESVSEISTEVDESNQHLDLMLGPWAKSGSSLSFGSQRRNGRVQIELVMPNEAFMKQLLTLSSDRLPTVAMIPHNSDQPGDWLISFWRERGYHLATLGGLSPDEIPIEMGGRPLRNPMKFLIAVRSERMQGLSEPLQEIRAPQFLGHEKVTFENCPRPLRDSGLDQEERSLLSAALYKVVLSLRREGLMPLGGDVHTAILIPGVRGRLTRSEIQAIENSTNHFIDASVLTSVGNPLFRRPFHIGETSAWKIEARPSVSLFDISRSTQILGESRWSHEDTEWLLGYEFDQPIGLLDSFRLPARPTIQIGLLATIVHFFDLLPEDSPLRDLVLTNAFPVLSAEHMLRRAQQRHEAERRVTAGQSSENAVMFYGLNRNSNELSVIRAANISLLQSAIEGRHFDDRFQIEGPADVLAEACPVVTRPVSMLNQGRPRLIRNRRELLNCPDVAGVYRIVRRPTPEYPSGQIYIGQANRLRTRLSAHEKIREWTWESDTGVEHIQLIVAKDLAQDACWDTRHLDDAEAEHIRRAKERQSSGGPHLVNITVGRNGRKAEVGTFETTWQPRTYYSESENL